MDTYEPPDPPTYKELFIALAQFNGLPQRATFRASQRDGLVIMDLIVNGNAITGPIPRFRCHMTEYRLNVSEAHENLLHQAVDWFERHNLGTQNIAAEIYSIKEIIRHVRRTLPGPEARETLRRVRVDNWVDNERTRRLWQVALNNVTRHRLSVTGPGLGDGEENIRTLVADSTGFEDEVDHFSSGSHGVIERGRGTGGRGG